MKSKDAWEKQTGLMLARYEYENLITALRLALRANASIKAVYVVLSIRLDAQHDEERGLALGELVLAQLGRYPVDALTAAFVVELIGVVDDIARRQIKLPAASCGV